MIAQGIDKDCQDHRRFGSGHHGLHNHASHHDYSTDLIDLLRRKGIETGSISKACFENGFHGLSYFAQVFKRKTGYTPSQYLKEHKKVLQNQPSAGSSQPLFKREHNVQIDTDPNLPQRNPFKHVSAFRA
ncbi:MAG: AraC family transcriptional regulator [Clostridia bacterium]|nr:AraC family transcriptional regulator [Clostridia bacterium]